MPKEGQIEFVRNAFDRIVPDRIESAKNSNGEFETNPQYLQATNIKLSKKQPKDSIHVDIKYEGETFRSRTIEWGPLDLDPEKSTVLVKTKTKKWILFWFLKEDVKGLNNLLTHTKS